MIDCHLVIEERLSKVLNMLDEAYDRVLTGDDKKMKKIAMENLRTKGELLYRIENQHHQRDNRSYGQKLRHAIKNNQSK